MKFWEMHMPNLVTDDLLLSCGNRPIVM